MNQSKTVLFAILTLTFSLVFSGEALAADAEAGKAKFQLFCASCHGQMGAGDGPAGAALNPKPRTFADAEWQKKVTDEHIAKVIKEGGAAVGLSPLMPPWGASLSDEDVTNIVAFIRSLNPAK